MKALIAKDDGDLRRLDQAIAEFEARPPAERLRKVFLLQALLAQRASLRQGDRRRRTSPRMTTH